jgi:hypothetical protein
MVFSQSASTTTSTTLPSGISNIPVLLSLPKFLDSTHINRLENILCYIQDHPGSNGLAVLIYRDIKNDDVFVLTGDWYGNALELNTDESIIAKAAKEFIKNKLVAFLDLMRTIKIEQAQYYFSIKKDEIVLEEVRTAINKLAGPGFIRDIFSTIIQTPTIRKIEPLNPNNIEAMIKNGGSFEGDIIIKPSRFRLFDENQEEHVPLYVELLR